MASLAQSTSCISTALSLDRPELSRNHVWDPVAAGRDTELIIAAQAGSASAFDELYRQYSPRLFRTILRMTRNREDAEDALQETFMHAYLALHKFEGRSSVYCWLTRIAINTALMILRRRRCRPDAMCTATADEGDGYTPLEIKDTAYNPEQLCDLRQRSECLVQAIRKLEPALRGAIEIQLNGDYTLKEMAEIMDISVAAVKARLFRARARLSRRFSAHSKARKEPPPRASRGLSARHQVQEEEWVVCAETEQKSSSDTDREAFAHRTITTALICRSDNLTQQRSSLTS
jgi:RNA polymerase sigma-70 factor, ECF subfamily